MLTWREALRGVSQAEILRGANSVLTARGLDIKNLHQSLNSVVRDLQAGSYTNYFADALLAEAERDSRIIGIHAAMGGGTGMNRFSARFPERTFDVGIAEQHAVGASTLA